MDKKTKIFFLVFFLLIIGSVAFTYYRIMVKKDYIIEGQTDCDPYTEKCFIWECDPDSTVEGEACTGDSETDIWYYKIARRNASRIPLCDPDTDEECDPWTCAPDELDCSEILCDEETKVDQEAECNDPEQYTIDNPVEEEEAVECEDPPVGEAGGDEECLAAEEETVCEEGDEECAANEEETGEETGTVGGEAPIEE